MGFRRCQQGFGWHVDSWIKLSIVSPKAAIAGHLTLSGSLPTISGYALAFTGLWQPGLIFVRI